MNTTNLAELYDLAPLEWADVETRLEAGFDQTPGAGGPDRHTSWLTTLNEDGSPHVTGVGAIWADGSFWFQTGPSTRKGRNVARDPRCVLSLATHEFDLVVEGTAALVTEPDVVAARAHDWASGGWPARPDPSGRAITAEFSAPSAGRPPWSVYRIDVRRAHAVATVEPGGATRWQF
ncbi:MAG: pyridoxamine 5'-phosphate oxidase family protein [Propionibacteriaceae bacterium]